MQRRPGLSDQDEVLGAGEGMKSQGFMSGKIEDIWWAIYTGINFLPLS